MDELWERSIEVYTVTKHELVSVLRLYMRCDVLDYSLIESGCRNSNYKVKTTKGSFLVRVCPIETNGYKNEQAVSNTLDSSIKIPKLLYVTQLNRRTVLIYEFINGQNLQKLISSEQLDMSTVIKQVAKTAALIHNTSKEQIEGLYEIDLPPFETWYDLFLNNELSKERLGTELISRLKELVKREQKKIKQIDAYQSFIHSDFRPQNMLVTPGQEYYVLDWEFAGFGHTLADIGQFFRYRNCFSQTDFNRFEKTYNEFADVKLPANFSELSLLRDLINLLQMIGTNLEQPNKFQDLKALINLTVDYFEQ